MRHPWWLPILLCPLTLSAAEPLGNAGMEKTYIPTPKPCPPGKKKNAGEDCTAGSATQKPLHEVEKEATDRLLDNPQGPAPSAPPLPQRLPEAPPVTPQQQELMQQIEQIPSQLNR